MSTQAPARPSAAVLRRAGLRGIVALAGVVLAAAIMLTADRDPFVFAVPVLVLAAVLVAALSLGDAGGEERAMREAAAETGLAYDGIRPLPPVTSILAGVDRPVPVLVGPVHPGGPDVRLARVGGGLVAITDAPTPGIDGASRDWLDAHPLRPRAAIDEGLLVVAAGADARPRDVVELARQLYVRL